MIALHATYDAEGPDGVKLFSIVRAAHTFTCRVSDSLQSKKFSIGSKGKLECKFENLAHDGRKLELQLRGDWFDRSAEITLDGVPVARIARSFMNMREVLSDKQTVRLVAADLAYAAVLPRAPSMPRLTDLTVRRGRRRCLDAHRHRDRASALLLLRSSSQILDESENDQKK